MTSFSQIEQWYILVFSYSKGRNSKEWSDTWWDSTRSSKSTAVDNSSCSWCSVYYRTVVYYVRTWSTLVKSNLCSVRRRSPWCSAESCCSSNCYTSISTVSSFVRNCCSCFSWVSHMKSDISACICTKRRIDSSKEAIESSILWCIGLRHKSKNKGL